jgi:hypothetical protein
MPASADVEAVRVTTAAEEASPDAEAVLPVTSVAPALEAASVRATTAAASLDAEAAERARPSNNRRTTTGATLAAAMEAASVEAVVVRRTTALVVRLESPQALSPHP